MAHVIRDHIRIPIVKVNGYIEPDDATGAITGVGRVFYEIVHLLKLTK